jgi:hypothetical protein
VKDPESGVNMPLIAMFLSEVDDFGLAHGGHPGFERHRSAALHLDHLPLFKLESALIVGGARIMGAKQHEEGQGRETIT